jgi:hypothetical protein
LIAKLLDQAGLCDQLAAEMTFDEHRIGLLAMATHWREVAEVVQAQNTKTMTRTR